VVGQVNAGRVRALGVSSTARVPALPNVPTIAESGVPGFDAVGWTMICAPSATPKPVIDRLHAELKAVAATPEVREVIVRIGTIPVASPPPAELQKFLASEIDRWGSLIQRAGLAGCCVKLRNCDRCTGEAGLGNGLIREASLHQCRGITMERHATTHKRPRVLILAVVPVTGASAQQDDPRPVKKI
jgi:hypothetical protein